MYFTSEELKELSQHLRNFWVLQDSEGSKVTVVRLKSIEEALVRSLSRAITHSKTTTLELDSEQLSLLSRAILKASPELVSKIRHTVFLQKTSEAFDNED